MHALAGAQTSYSLATMWPFLLQQIDLLQPCSQYGLEQQSHGLYRPAFELPLAALARPVYTATICPMGPERSKGGKVSAKKKGGGRGAWTFQAHQSGCLDGQIKQNESTYSKEVAICHKDSCFWAWPTWGTEYLGTPPMAFGVSLVHSGTEATLRLLSDHSLGEPDYNFLLLLGSGNPPQRGRRCCSFRCQPLRTFWETWYYLL